MIVMTSKTGGFKLSICWYSCGVVPQNTSNRLSFYLVYIIVLMSKTGGCKQFIEMTYLLMRLWCCPYLGWLEYLYRFLRCTDLRCTNFCRLSRCTSFWNTFEMLVMLANSVDIIVVMSKTGGFKQFIEIINYQFNVPWCMCTLVYLGVPWCTLVHLDVPCLV